jgi:hypothetical protein
MSFLKPTRSEFISAVVRSIGSHAGIAQVDMEGRSLTRSDGRIFYFDNAYDEYRAAPPWMRRRIVTFYSRQVIDTNANVEYTAEQARGILMPKVRERAYHEIAKLQFRVEGRGNEYDPPHKVFGGGHLTLEVVLDQPTTIRSVAKPDLERWSLTFAEALDIAQSNIMARNAAGGFEEVRPGLFRSIWRDQYDSSRLLYNAMFASLPVKGRPVAMVPNRDVLLITGDSDVDGLVQMAKASEETLKKPRPMTGIAFRLDAGWVPFLPPADHAAYKRLCLLAVRTMAEITNHQKELLDKILDDSADPNPPFVATYMARELPNGRIASISSWAEGVDTMLPRTDRIAFGRIGPGGKPGEMVGFGEWDGVMAVMGGAVELVDGLYPERFRVRTFPTDDQFKAMGLVDM